jgi:hypothetical protein
MFLDKTLLSSGLSIGGLLLLVNGFFASKSRGWRCRWEKEVEQRPLFLRNRSPLVFSPVKKAF